MLKAFPLPISREGLPFIALFAGISLGLGYFAWPLGVAGAVATAWCVWFFRDPDRTPPARPGVIVSPADGRVIKVGPAPPPAELGMGQAARTRISTFMNIFDVHVNRIPADGTVTALHYRPGRFINASFDKASEHNERLAIRMTTAEGADLAVVQIAGLLARRIKCSLKPGQRVRAGERFGMIRFGSRVDLYLPTGVPALVVAGAKAVAGETVMADALANEPGREGGGAG